MVGNGSYDERYAYDVSTGNLQSKTVRNINGTYTASTYGYQDTAHVHGVTHLNGTQKYWYDANGNQIKRIVGTYTYDLTYDAENRLVEVKKGGVLIATFVYNGDGERVRSTVNSVTTAFVGNILEWTGSTTSMKKYYYAGSQRVAMRTGSSTLNFILGDHLGSTSLTTSGVGAYQSETLYKPWGKVRYTSGTLPTKYTFTGQYSNVSDFGLMYYNARWYDPLLGRFSSADTIIPQPGNPQSWDRYSYSNNNPVNYFDPSGHISIPVNTDDCGPDGIYCLNNSNINWDPTTNPGLSKTDKALAEQAYLHAVEDPGYFLNLYFNTDASLWLSNEVAYLDIYLQYCNLHLTAEEYILQGMDIYSARISRAYLNSGDIEAGNNYLGNALGAFAMGVTPSHNGETSHTIRGREAHNNYKYALGSDYDYKVVLPSGLKPDAVDWANMQVRELKPDNANAIARGWRQLNKYISELQQVTGQTWQGFLDTYRK